MSQLHLSDEILMAFADGELDEPVAAAVAKAMAESPGVANRIKDFQQSRRLTRSAFASLPMPDVPPELRAAISAQVRIYQAASEMEEEAQPAQKRSGHPVRSFPILQMAMAACIAAMALALGYFAGRQGSIETSGLIAQLESPLVQRELSRIASGENVELPFGRIRVISSHRLANGFLCREFRLESSPDAAQAVACRNGEWTVTFAAANGVSDGEYTPSSGGDLMAAYLQSIGAGQPLVDAAEAQALAEVAR